MKCSKCGIIVLPGNDHFCDVDLFVLDGKKNLSSGIFFKINLLKLGDYKSKIKNFFKRN